MERMRRDEVNVRKTEGSIVMAKTAQLDIKFLVGGEETEL